MSTERLLSAHVDCQGLFTYYKPHKEIVAATDREPAERHELQKPNPCTRVRGTLWFPES